MPHIMRIHLLCNFHVRHRIKSIYKFLTLRYLNSEIEENESEWSDIGRDCEGKIDIGYRKGVMWRAMRKNMK